ncbi:hypothetical protein MSAN_02289900 [Mycena sanguinolenta]|uniref:F-box domain-containing protein n=1 Tax=Mycena sanguinolenta TaxID=230812 RepID=A0A8H6X9J5_9AGAR|nr:hypothetical protein MSAN_02289900 [Mycena sanguinolenta]
MPDPGDTDPPTETTDVNLDVGPIMATLAHLMATNEPPFDSESVLLRPAVKSARARLGAVDAELSDLKRCMERLERERGALSRFEAGASSVLSPIRRVPREALVEIFGWMLDSTEPSPRETCSVLSIANPPWVLAHVCSLWRAVAVATPSLWGSVTIDFDQKKRYSEEMLRTQIARARLLNIRFFATEKGDLRHQVALFAALTKASARWQRLTIQVSSRLAREQYELDLRSLRSVWLQWVSPNGDMQDAFTMAFLRTATGLVDIGVHCHPHALFSLPPVHYAITRYDVDGSWTTHFDLLRLLPDLREARIAVRERWADPAEKTIVLPDLRLLYIDDPECLQAFDVPALDAMAATVEDPSELQALEWFLERSAPRRICFHGHIETEGLDEVLANCPSLTDIGLSFDGCGTRKKAYWKEGERAHVTAFLEIFAPAPGTPATAALLPHVTEIRLACELDDPTYLPLFLRTLGSRMNAEPRTIKAAELVCLQPEVNPPPHSVERLKALQEEGLQVSLSCGEVGRRMNDRWLCKAGWL